MLVVLGAIAGLHGFSILKLIRYIKDELLIVLGTSSSEAALPRIMAKLQRLGARKPIVGLVIPTGYSFNLDGTNIYMTLATLFIAQATNTPLTSARADPAAGVAMLTLQGRRRRHRRRLHHAGRHAGGRPAVPVAGLALILGVDRFMSECRALTNFIGNAVRRWSWPAGKANSTRRSSPPPWRRLPEEGRPVAAGLRPPKAKTRPLESNSRKTKSHRRDIRRFREIMNRSKLFRPEAGSPAAACSSCRPTRTLG